MPNHELNRRECLANAVNWTESIAAAIVPFCMQLSKSKLFNALEQPKGNILVDVAHPLEQGGAMRNLGVIHDRRSYMSNKAFFERAIDECDVVLTEHYRKDFFGPLMRYATANGKKVMMIDDYRQTLSTLSKLFPIAASLALMKEQLMTQKKHKEENVPATIFHARRNILRAVSVGAIAISLLDEIPAGLQKDPALYKGFNGRARSAAQFKHAQEVMQEDPSKQYLLLTGGAHAQMFEYYIQHPEKLQEDLKEYAIHLQIFGHGKKEIHASDF